MKTSTTSWTAGEHEAALVRAFVVPRKRARILELLSNPRRRKDILCTLNHFRDLDPSRMIRIAGSQDSQAFLQSCSAPGECYVLSANPRLDARHMPLKDALDAIDIGFHGTLLSCIPGKLGYYAAEEFDRFLLRRESQFQRSAKLSLDEILGAQEQMAKTNKQIARAPATNQKSRTAARKKR